MGDAWEITLSLPAARAFAQLAQPEREQIEAKCAELARLLAEGAAATGQHAAQVGQCTLRCASDAGSRTVTVRTIERLPPPSDKPRVLVVDDDPDLRWALADQLQGAGFTVETAGDGLEALSKLQRGFAADAILLDIVMPVMSGSEFLEYRKREPRLAAIPTVVVTANPHLAVGLAVNEVLKKPLEARKLHSVMRSLPPRG